MEPELMFWGDLMCKIEDSDGYIWDIAKNLTDFDPSKNTFLGKLIDFNQSTVVECTTSNH